MSLERANLLLILMLAAPAGFAGAQPRTGPPARPSVPPAARLSIEPRQPGTGSLVRVTIDSPLKSGDSIIVAVGELAGEPLHFTAGTAGHRLALAAIPLDASDSVVARVVVDRASGIIDTLRTVLHYPHRAPPPPSPAGSRGRAPGPARRLRVDTKFTQRMDSATEARIEHDNALAREVGHHAHDTPKLWTFPFLRPRPSKVTSKFGSGRVFNGRVSSSHLGVDYRGADGEPIYAANRGVVALVAEFFLAGNVVYIDHGAGVVTGYFHMSKPEVSVGDTVQRGQEIGLVGATGRVTGPHLHWSARYGALTIDPGDLLSIGAPFAAPDTTPKKRPAKKP